MAFDFGPLRALVRDLNFDAHGRPATVSRPAPNDEPITTRIVWLLPGTDGAPVSAVMGRTDDRLVMALRRDEVPTVPKGTRVVAAKWGETAARTWVVDGTDRVEDDHVRVRVVEQSPS